MQTGLYRKTVMKALSTKPAKLGLKLVSKSNARTNLALASVGMATELGIMLRVLNPYILGFQITQEMKDAAKEPFGCVGYHLTILCRVLKISTPTATKKSKLVGTRTAGLLQLASYSTDILALFAANFEGPRMHDVERVVVLPKQGGKKELRVVRSVDPAANAKLEAERLEKLKSLVTATVDLYWRLSFNIFGVPPSVIFDFNAASIKKKMAVVPPPKPKVLSSKSSVVFTAGPKAKNEVLSVEVPMPKSMVLAAHHKKLMLSGATSESVVPSPKTIKAPKVTPPPPMKINKGPSKQAAKMGKKVTNAK